MAEAAVRHGFDLVRMMVTDRGCRCGGEYFIGAFRKSGRSSVDVRVLLFHTEPRCKEAKTLSPRDFAAWNSVEVAGPEHKPTRKQRRAEIAVARRRNKAAKAAGHKGSS